MQFKLFSIPATGDAEAEEELNRFLRSHRAVSVQKELVQGGQTAYWCFCIEYLLDGVPQGKGGGRARVDYKELLSTEDFAVFVRLRQARKDLAGNEAIPVYAVCTNEQLAEMAKGVLSAGGSNRVNRGGSWNNTARKCRAANRNNNGPGNRNNNLGLRVCRA